MAELLGRLDADQRAAVTAPVGPVAVLAGAGSGKTRVLTTRIAYRIAQGSAHPSHVVAFTFTRQAATELVKRLERLGVDSAVVAGTFHGVAYRILRRRWEDRGRSVVPTLVPNRIELLTEVLQGDRRLAGVMAGEIDWARARLVDPGSYVGQGAAAGRRPSVGLERVAEVFSAYEAYKRKRRVLDFDDLLTECVGELSRPGVGAAVGWWHRHLHVDEFQDINPAQFQFLEALRQANTDVFIVGDPAQAIYGWNGADPGLLEAVQHGPLRPTVVELGTNYRSIPEVVEAGDRVLANAKIARVHRAVRPPGHRVHIMSASDDIDEARLIVELARSWRMPGSHWSSVAVLARTHQVLRRIADEFARAGIPTRTVTRSGSGDPQAAALVRQARSAPDAQALRAWAVDLAWPEDADDSTERERSLRALEAVRSFRDVGGGSGRAFAAWASLHDIDDDPDDAVELVTMHAAKGREWPVVIVAGVDSSGFPVPGGAGRLAARTEEARLLYVSLTRAIDRLGVTWAKQRGTQRCDRSPLLEGLEHDRTSVDVSSPPVRPTRHRIGRRIEADPVLARLRTWRASTAKVAGVPPAFLLDDATLARVARALPEDLDALAAIEGVGTMLARRFGPRLLEVIAAPT